MSLCLAKSPVVYGNRDVCDRKYAHPTDHSWGWRTAPPTQAELETLMAWAARENTTEARIVVRLLVERAGGGVE